MTEPTVFGSPLRRGLICQRVLTKKSGPLSRRTIEYWEKEMEGIPPLTPEERMPAICVGCGHFTSWQSDNYTNFGSAYDMEPPDPSYLCDRCLAIDICDAMTLQRMPQHWLPAAWEYQVAKLIGFRRAGPPGAAWSRWEKDGESLHEGWVWHDERRLSDGQRSK